MNALVRAVCGGASAPREWRRSLRAQRVVLRSSLLRSPLAAVGTRVDGTVLGAELIDTLSDRLARSIQGWNAPQDEPLIAAERRRVMQSVEAADARRTMPSPIVHGTVAEKPGTVASSPISTKRSWNNGIEAAGRAIATSAPPIDAHRARVDAAIAERGAEILRVVGLDVPRASTKRDAVRMSPLDVALRQYRQASPASEPASKTVASSAPAPDAPRTARVAAAGSGATAPRSPVATAPSEVAPRSYLSHESPETPQREWWSMRVDAIHSRHESFVPAAPRPGAARFEDDATDESAFADTLAEVLHRQARAYGVVVP